jgi:hypothetical protein
MGDVIFVGITIVFFAICALYVMWCDRIIGPDDFTAPGSGRGTGVPEIEEPRESRGVRV